MDTLYERNEQKEEEMIICDVCKEEFQYPNMWTYLKHLGVQIYKDIALEIRQCPCGNTLSRKMSPRKYEHYIQ